MAIKGDLHEISLPTLVQLVIQEGGQALLQLRHENGNIGQLYMDNGDLCHANVFHANNLKTAVQTGEEAVYELLSWRNGEFHVKKQVSPPARTIKQNWSYLLMEGLRQLDEKQLAAEELPQEDSIADILSELSQSDSAIIQELMAQKETDTMASKTEQLQSILNSVIQNSTEIIGAAVVDNDGLLLASALSGPIDGNRVAAVSAGLISLASRSAQQLNQGSVTRTLIQAEQGNVIAIRTGSKASLVALTPTGVNLGMAFLECSEMASSIQRVL
ncbi:MAG: DUF4388 domain-containing protein [Ardenticatenaceae bacterium]|nr:DUF4388 domain-containing protein [Anaerolineales bacterium]MCB8923303.1 DUF4388 domain-containing protein [Ardenticatenaceae bacterium]MCB8992043.1 DUF4388 domain-containing protein [Ardenticatenaceae bacterium]MCB9004698.1 DUF4388 domain-containing protein [Ardenticatenaceae bacterium]